MIGRIKNLNSPQANNNKPMTPALSKSKIMNGLQCQKRLWLEVHKPQLLIVSADVEHRFDIGHMVNDIACSLHENGHLIEWDGGVANALAETKRLLMESPEKPLFEATFSHQGVLVRTDILKKNADGYHLIEVKSSTCVKEQYYADCAVQAWILEGNGLSLNRVELAHIDNQFVYRGAGDYRELFHYADLSSSVAEQKPEVSKWVNRFQKTLQGAEPNIEIGDHCYTPYSCPFIDYCSGCESADTDYPLTCLPRGRKIAKELECEGITDIRNIPSGRLHNETHEWVRKVTVSGRSELKPAVKKIIRAYPYPRYYLDFETTRFAVPIWADTRPYQALPFQWSCHIEADTDELAHQEFLDASGIPPMRGFIESLLRAVGKSGPIFVYSSFEKSRLNELASRFADLQPAIQQVVERLVDLLPITRQYYYHPDMRGSWSIKAVLPTIAPNLNYSDLGEIQDGSAAESAYQECIEPDTTQQRRKSLSADLLEYCKRDTEALVVLVRFLSRGKKNKSQGCKSEQKNA